MLGFFSILKRDIALEEALLKKYQRQLKEAPDGCLSFRTVKGKRYYRQVFCQKNAGGDIQKTYHSLNPSDIKDAKLLSALAQKAYARKTVRILQENLKLQKKLEKSYQSYGCQAIESMLSKTYRNLPIIPTDSSSERVREIAEKQRKALLHAIHPENLTHQTLAGFKVRSKSETIICNILTERGILFVYEEPIHLFIPGEGPVTLHPDFVIYLPDGSIVIWEHLGLLSEKSYAESFAKKLRLYHQAGFPIGSRLFLTSDTIKGQLDMDAVLHVVDLLKAMGA